MLKRALWLLLVLIGPAWGQIGPGGGGTPDENLQQIGGTTVLTGAGATGAGAQRVGVAQDATTVAGSAPGMAGTPSTNVISIQGISGGTSVPVTAVISQGPLTIVALDAATVTTGGTAASASVAGHHNKGGWILNPSTATINLCINEQGTASGTTSAGALTCIVPGQAFNITPNATSVVSVISSDSSHAFSGQGYN